MPRNDDWIAKRVAEAGKSHPLVTESVSIRMDELLRDQLRVHNSKTELAAIGQELIESMTGGSSKPETE